MYEVDSPSQKSAGSRTKRFFTHSQGRMSLINCTSILPIVRSSDEGVYRLLKRATSTRARRAGNLPVIAPVSSSERAHPLFRGSPCSSLARLLPSWRPPSSAAWRSCSSSSSSIPSHRRNSSISRSPARVESSRCSRSSTSAQGDCPSHEPSRGVIRQRVPSRCPDALGPNASQLPPSQYRMLWRHRSPGRAQLLIS